MPQLPVTSWRPCYALQAGACLHSVYSWRAIQVCAVLNTTCPAPHALNRQRNADLGRCVHPRQVCAPTPAHYCRPTPDYCLTRWGCSHQGRRRVGRGGGGAARPPCGFCGTGCAGWQGPSPPAVRRPRVWGPRPRTACATCCVGGAWSSCMHAMELPSSQLSASVRGIVRSVCGWVLLVTEGWVGGQGMGAEIA